MAEPARQPAAGLQPAAGAHGTAGVRAGPGPGPADALRVVTARLLVDHVRLWRGLADLAVARGRVLGLGPLRPSARQGWGLFAGTGPQQRPVSLPQLPGDAVGPAQEWLQSSSARIQQAYAGLPWRQTADGRNLAARLGQGISRLGLSTVLGQAADTATPSPSSPTRTPADVPGVPLLSTEANSTDAAAAQVELHTAGAAREEAAADAAGGAPAVAGASRAGQRGLASESSVAGVSVGASSTQPAPMPVPSADAETATVVGGAGAAASSLGVPRQPSEGPSSTWVAPKAEPGFNQQQQSWWSRTDAAGGRARWEGLESPGSVQAIAGALVDRCLSVWRARAGPW